LVQRQEPQAKGVWILARGVRQLVDKAFDGKNVKWGGNRSPPGTALSTEPEALSFMGALNDQLGLKLKPGKASLPILIVDHVQRPSEN
jgi:uncharacterized protein (TIGR03435 family)